MDTDSMAGGDVEEVQGRMISLDPVVDGILMDSFCQQQGWVRVYGKWYSLALSFPLNVFIQTRVGLLLFLDNTTLTEYSNTLALMIYPPLFVTLSRHP